MHNYSIHPQAICQSSQIGSDSHIEAFSYLSSTCVIGSKCKIDSHVTISDSVSIGDGVTIGAGSHIANNVQLDKQVSIGSNVTINNNIKIGMHAGIAPGTVVTHNIPPHAQISGNPAEVDNFNSQHDENYLFTVPQTLNSKLSLGVGNCQLWSVKKISDKRGSLLPIDLSQHTPFIPKKFFLVRNVPAQELRGLHANKLHHEFSIVTQGSINFVVDDGKNRIEAYLDRPDIGLYMPTGIWGVQYKFSPDAALAVFTSQPYSEENYLRDYTEFLQYIKEE